jgi:hypothetical protein
MTCILFLSCCAARMIIRNWSVAYVELCWFGIEKFASCNVLLIFLFQGHLAPVRPTASFDRQTVRPSVVVRSPTTMSDGPLNIRVARTQLPEAQSCIVHTADSSAGGVEFGSNLNVGSQLGRRGAAHSMIALNQPAHRAVQSNIPNSSSVRRSHSFTTAPELQGTAGFGGFISCEALIYIWHCIVCCTADMLLSGTVMHAINNLLWGIVQECISSSRFVSLK